MNIRVAIKLTAMAVILTHATNDCLKTRREEQAKRADIQKNLDKDLAAIRSAGALMQEKIAAGEYDGKSLNQLFADQEFYILAHREGL